MSHRINVVNLGRRLYARASQRPAMVIRPRLRIVDVWIAFLRLVVSCVIIAGLSFGARQSYFSVGVSRVWGTELDADLKLALLGFFNKSLDVFLVSSLEYTASIMLTIWMARAGTSSTSGHVDGATFSDFGLKDELTKPWMTLVSFFTRWQQSRWSWKSFLRCVLCLSISISVMLQGLAINTIAVPKARWYPNYLHTWQMTEHTRNTMSVDHPKTFLQAVDWYNLLGVGQSNVGREGYSPWDWALALSASLSFAGLSRIVPTVALQEKNWQHVYHWQLDGEPLRRWSALNTSFDHSDQPIETISTDDQQVTEIFEWLRKVNYSQTSSSTGWTGNLTVVVPALNTVCTLTDQPAQNASFIVTVPDDKASSTPTFSVSLGSIPSMNFTGAICSSTFRQALYPVNFWIVDMNGVDLSFNGYGIDWDKTIVYEPTIVSDYKIIQLLAIQTRDSLPRIEPMVQSAGLLNHFLLMSRTLQSTDSAVQSDAASLSIIMGVLLQNMLSVANKYRSPLPAALPLELSERTSSYPIQWQLYGSVPRLAWEWLAVMVLVIVLTSLCFGVYQALRQWMGPGSWTELGGMLMIAQTSPPLGDMSDEVKARERMYWVDIGTNGKLVLKSKVS
jgi:hypothetical protein